jgi:hypothetical protein
MYITMRHLFNRGFYKPMGISEILWGKRGITSWNIWKYCGRKVELNGLCMLLSVFLWIEECRFINLTSAEGYSKSISRQLFLQKEKKLLSDRWGTNECGNHPWPFRYLWYFNTFDIYFIESHKIRNRCYWCWWSFRDWMKLQYAVSQNKNYLL